MKQKKEEEDYEGYEIKWWKDWLDADILEREEMVGKLPFVREILQSNNLPHDIRKHTITMMLNSFFSDLESAMYIKLSKEQHKSLDAKKKSIS